MPHVVSLAALALAGFALAWMFNANAKLALLQQAVEVIVSDKDADKRQDDTLIKHWKIVSWSKDRINELRAAQGLPLASWPDL
ncbi:MAG: hypothetical protein ACE5FM_00055 [Methyloligellaceae bacterium]